MSILQHSSLPSFYLFIYFVNGSSECSFLDHTAYFHNVSNLQCSNIIRKLTSILLGRSHYCNWCVCILAPHTDLKLSFCCLFLPDRVTVSMSLSCMLYRYRNCVEIQMNTINGKRLYANAPLQFPLRCKKRGNLCSCSANFLSQQIHELFFSRSIVLSVDT